MIFSASIFSFILIFLIWTVPCFLLVNIIKGFETLDLITILFIGLFVSGSFFSFTKYIANKVKPLRKEILQTNSIICEGPANHLVEITDYNDPYNTAHKNVGIGGWLFFTDEALEFYQHHINFGGDSFAIPNEDITAVGRHRNKLIIKTEEETFVFVVNKSRRWDEIIYEFLESGQISSLADPSATLYGAYDEQLESDTYSSVDETVSNNWYEEIKYLTDNELRERINSPDWQYTYRVMCQEEWNRRNF